MFPRFRSRARQDELAPVDPKAEDQVSTSPEAEVMEARASEPLAASDGAQDAALGEGVVEPGELTDGKGQCIDRDCSDSSPHNHELPPENSLPLKGDPDAPNSGSQEAVPGQDPSREDAPASEPCDTVFHARELGRKRPRIESGPSSSKGLKPSPSLVGKSAFTPEQRLLLLDTWRRSGLPAKDFAALINVSKHTLYKWNEQFQRYGPEGLMDQPRRVRRGSKLPDLTRRTILMLKESHPEWGCQRISDMMLRGPALSASASAVARVLHEAGYEVEEVPLRSHPDRVRRFERAKPNELWQTDLFTFTLKRQNRRLHLVAFMDDHSRFLVSYGLHATASTALVLEALEAGIASYGVPEEILTDNGPQYVTWRGKSRFTKQLEKRGIRQIVARPRRPQTLGKIERFWGTLWRELLESAIFVDLGDARTRIGLYVDYYNLQRTHRGIGGRGHPTLPGLGDLSRNLQRDRCSGANGARLAEPGGHTARPPRSYTPDAGATAAAADASVHAGSDRPGGGLADLARRVPASPACRAAASVAALPPRVAKAAAAPRLSLDLAPAGNRVGHGPQRGHAVDRWTI